MPFGLGIGEIALVVLLLLLLFGARRIPLIARGLGRGIRNFKDEVASPEQPDRLESGEEDEDSRTR